MDDKHKEEDATSAVLISHIRVNAIADYYDISPLKSLANKNVEEILQNSWSPDGFSDVIQEVLDSTADKILRDIVSSSAAMNIGKLITRDDFTGIPVMSPFLVDTMRKIEAKHVAKEDELQLQICTKTHDAIDLRNTLETTKLDDARKRMLDILSQTKICRNCGDGFRCFVYKATSGAISLKCCKCLCKHGHF